VLLFGAGLLEEPEAAELRAHLAAGCAECAAHLDEARAVEAALALAAPEAEPLPALRSELLRRIGRVPRLAPRAPRRASFARRFVPSALAAGLASLLAAPLGWFAASLHYETRSAARTAQLNALQERQSALEQELAETRADYDDLDGEIAEMEARSRTLESDLERAQRQVAMLTDAGLVTLDLRPVRAGSEARARVFWEWDDYYCYLHAEGLGAAQPPQVYALWLDTEKSGRILAGTFAPEEGRATLWVQLPRDIGRALGAHVTLEPEAPGPSPGGAMELSSGSARPL
jgi:hypothetical protein